MADNETAESSMVPLTDLTGFLGSGKATLLNRIPVRLPVEEIPDIRGFNLSTVFEVDPEFLEEDEHEHAQEVSSFVFRSERPFDGVRPEHLLSGLIQAYGKDMLRCKGVVYLNDNAHRVVFRGVPMLMGGDLGKARGK